MTAQIPEVNRSAVLNFEQAEIQTNKYLALFHQALESQKLPDYDSQELQALKTAFSKWPASSDLHDDWRELNYKLDTALWMEHALKHQEYAKVIVRQTDRGEHLTLVILQGALQLDCMQFYKIFEPLTKVGCTIYVTGQTCHKKYTCAALGLFLSGMQEKNPGFLTPILLSPNKQITVKLRGGTSVQYTPAEYWMLLRGSLPETTEVDFSDFDEQTLQFAYGANVDLGATDTRWYSSHSSDQCLRLRQFLEKAAPNYRELYIYTNVNFLQGTSTIHIAEDRLELEEGQFKTEMKDLLNYCKDAKQVKIRQAGSRFPLIFTREQFEKLLEKGPGVFRLEHQIKCKNGKEYSVTSDFYQIVMEHLSQRKAPGTFRAIKEIDLSEHEKQNS